MADKPVEAEINVQIEGANAKPAPPLGPALGQYGVQIMDFCNEFNEATQDRAGDIVPCTITVYADRSFDFELKTTPASAQIKQAIGLESGSGEPHEKKVGTITREQLEEIAEDKEEDLNARDMDAAVKILAGTCRSMGVEVEES